MGGAESNVAIGLSRLGTPVTWVSRLGDDALGTYLLREIRGEGVTVRAARDPEAPTGLMLKEHRNGKPSRVRYYRAGSAASRLSPSDVDEKLIGEAGILHLTGITPALGPGPRAAVAHAIEVARAAGTLVSFDVNHRRTLWGDDEARETLRALLPGVDLLFAGPEEAALILDLPAPETTWESGEALAAQLAALGPATVVLKLGSLGALTHSSAPKNAAAPTHSSAPAHSTEPAAEADSADSVSGAAGAEIVESAETVRAEARPRTVVDPVGAGDAFVAGYLAELSRGSDPARCLAVGNEAGGAVVGVIGDWEGLPTAADLELTENDEVVR
jgi:2-dehydro-3-deoxygluconokinase